MQAKINQNMDCTRQETALKLLVNSNNVLKCWMGHMRTDWNKIKNNQQKLDRFAPFNYSTTMEWRLI